MALEKVGRDLFALRNHDAWEIHWRLARLDMACQCVRLNKKELLSFLADTGPAGTFGVPLNDHGRRQLYDLTVDAGRRLLNFLASSKQAIDHSRKTAKNLCKSTTRSAAVVRCVSLLKDDPESNFMTHLRNLLQHVTLAPLYVSIPYDARPGRLRLRRVDLLKDGELSGRARQYVDEHRGDLGLLGMSRRFGNLVIELVESVIRQIANENAPLLKSLYDESDRIIKEDAQRGLVRENLFIHRFVDSAG